jgi:hypothetical protein
MAMSKDALEAVEAIRRDLKVRVSIDTVERYYDNPGRLKVVVELALGDDVISKDESFVNLPN